MTIPSLLLAAVISLALGSLYHVLRGGGVWRLMFYLLMSAAGFALGHIIGLWRGWLLFQIGALNIGLSTIVSILLLVLGDWLSRIKVDDESTV